MTGIGRRRFLQIAAAATALTPGRATATAWRGVALGADVEIRLHGPRDPSTLPDILSFLRKFESQFSLHDPASALSHLNRTGEIEASREFRDLLETCDFANRVTGGLFDPTVQPLFLALARGDPPPLDVVGWDRVRVADRVALAPNQSLTLNGIAQGYATDRVRNMIAARGYTRALVHVGEFAALGGPWALEIRDPAISLPATLVGRARATSTVAAHLFHPKGLAAHWSTASVEADSATWADALSTALLFANREEAAKILALAPGLPTALLVDRKGDAISL